MKRLALIVFILTFMLASSVNAYQYEIKFFEYNDSSSPFDTYLPGFETDINCINQMQAKASMQGSSFSVTSSLYSPGSSSIGSGTITNQNSFTCKNIGYGYTSNKNGNVYEGYHSTTHTATSGNVSISSLYNCTSTGFWLNISINSTTDNTSYGYVVNRYSDFLASIQPNTTITPKINISNFNECVDITIDTSRYIRESATTTLAGTIDRQAQFFYPFNTTSGKIVYNFSTTVPYVTCSDNCVNTVTSQVYLFLVNMEDSSVQTLHAYSEDCSGGATIDDEMTGTINIEKDTLYSFVLVLNFDDQSGCSGATRSVTISEPEYVNYDVFMYRANYDCSEWSECDGTTQTRTCTDPAGIADPEIQFRTCGIGVIENATLGFEGFVRDDDMWKCSPSFSTFDPYYLNQTYRDSPLNWSVGENSYAKRDFLKMTTEWASEGSRSLKMWYIPPKNWEVILNTTGYPVDCGNTSGGTIPYVYQNVSNDTFEVSYNVTFPGENMILRYEVKGCEEQVLQHSEYYVYIPFTTIPITEVYPRLCYAGTCNGTPNSRYSVNLIDTTTGNSVFGYAKFRTASIYRPDQEIIDLSNLGLVAGREYTLVFSVYPENLDDVRGNCFYVDNVRYERIEEPLVETILGGSCSTQCIGDDLYEATLLQNGKCSVRVVSYGCAGDEINDALDSGNNVCEDANNLLRINPVTKLPETLYCPYGCSNGECNTETPTDPTEADDNLGNEALGFLQEPFTWAMIITLLSIIISAILMGRYNVKDAGYISLGVGLIVNIFFIVAEWTPFWWGIMLSAGLILLISNKVVNYSGLGGD